jgi:hypothetical protein
MATAPFDTDSLTAPARAPYVIAPSDAVPLPVVPKGIYIGTGGHVTLRGIDASIDVTYRNLPDASYLNVRAAYVRATGTTAADMIAEV